MTMNDATNTARFAKGRAPVDSLELVGLRTERKATSSRGASVSMYILAGNTVSPNIRLSQRLAACRTSTMHCCLPNSKPNFAVFNATMLHRLVCYSQECVLSTELVSLSRLPLACSRLTQLDEVSNSAHYDETNADCLRDFEEFAFVGYCVAFVSLRVRARLAETQKGGVRFVQRCRNCVPSLTKSRGMSAISLSWSDMVARVMIESEKDRIRVLKSCVSLGQMSAREMKFQVR